MNNIKAVAFTTDGRMKRLAVTYDVIDEEGKVIKSNNKVNRVVTDEEINAHIEAITEYAESIL